MERTHAIREDCPNCGSVAVDTTQVTLYHSVHEGKYVAALEFECPSPTHPQPLTGNGHIDVNRSRFVRYSIDTLDIKYQTPQFISNVRRVDLQNFRSDEQADPKRHDNNPILTERYVDLTTKVHLHEGADEFALTLEINPMNGGPTLGTPSQPVRLFDRLRARFKRRRT